jgi:anti-anti-sigma factor
MEIQILETSDALTRVALRGRLDTPGVDAIETRFNAALLPRAKNAIVDLSEVSFLSSMGLRMLLTAAKGLQRSGARLVLVSSRPLVDEALRHTALHELIPVVADVPAAAALLRA